MSLESLVLIVLAINAILGCGNVWLAARNLKNAKLLASCSQKNLQHATKNVEHARINLEHAQANSRNAKANTESAMLLQSLGAQLSSSFSKTDEDT